jgi:hypothetical protein
MKNRQKGQNVTKPIEAEPLIGSKKLHNESSLKKPYYKTNSFKTTFSCRALFTK